MGKDYMDITMQISRDIAEEIKAVVGKRDETFDSEAEPTPEDSPLGKMRDYILNWNLEDIYEEFDV
jgi:hypothetical protein